MREMRRGRNARKGVGNIMVRILVDGNDVEYQYFCFECGTLVQAELSDIESDGT